MEDLRRVVEWTGGGGPVVLVAHSFGALLAFALAHSRPELVGGLVLVDPVSLATWGACSAKDRARLQLGASLSRRGAWLAESGVVRAALALLQSGAAPLAKAVGRRAAGSGSPTLHRLTSEVSKLPRELWPSIAAHWSRADSFRTMAAMLDALPSFAAEVGPVELSPDLPVTILSAASATSEELCERDRWLRSVRESQHRMLPGTGHWLHLEEPELVAEAVRWCVERVRARI